MEDSEQRKKRLKEMRMQAGQAEASGDIGASVMPGSLSNPLIETSPTTPNATPRFDFYTDPMAAFSSNKRSNANFHDAPDYFPRPNLGGSPLAQFSSPRPESRNSQMTPSTHQVLPVLNRNPVSNEFRGPAHYNFPSHPSTGGYFRGPGFEPSGRPFFNPVQGLARRPSHSPNPSSGYTNSHSPGRGRGYWNNSRSPGLGRSGGQGTGSHRQHPDERGSRDANSFYKQSMVENPWNSLKPVLWKNIDTSLTTLYSPETSSSWRAKPLSTRWGGSSEASVKSSSQQSLAEQLAAAISEASNDAENV